MCPEPCSEKSTESPTPPPADGGTLVRSKPSKQRVATTDTSSKTSLMSDQKPKPRTDKVSAEKSLTAGSAPPNKKTTSKGKNKASEKPTPSTKSSEMSGLASISKGEDCCEWLTPYCKETSKKLLSRIRIGSAGSPLTSSSGYVKEETQISWSKNRSYVPRNRSLPKISWPLFTSSHANSTAHDGTKNKKPKDTTPMRSRRVRIKTTPEQARILRFWMKTHRQTYNEALRLVKDKKAKVNLCLKKLVVTRRESDKGSKFEAMKKSPADVRVSAVRALCKNFASAKAAYVQRKRNVKAGKVKNKRKRKKTPSTKRHRFKNNKPFEVKYKPRQLNSDAFDLEPKSLWMFEQSLTIFGSNSKYKLNLKVSESLSDSRVQPSHMCKIAYCFGRWYFIVPEIAEQHRGGYTPAFGEEERIVGIDPGLRKAFTCVSNSGRIDEIGINMREAMKKVKDKGKAILAAVKEATDIAKRKKLRRAWYRVNARAKDLVTDFHFKTIRFLLDNYDIIILGKINVQQLVSKEGQSQSNKDMFSFLSHYLFRQRLIMKTDVVPSKKVIIQDESYTTQTCVRCGVLKTDVGAAAIYKCSKCMFKIGRDISGASNILLRCASEFHQRTSKIAGKKRKPVA